MTQTAVVIAPGRGTYTKTELGYLSKRHAKKTDLIGQFDAYRTEQGQPTITALDAAQRYSLATHTRGDNASALIYSCSYADFLNIDQDAFDVIGVTGNSMGWYTALACGRALSALDGLKVVNTMGTLMHHHMIGGQIIYPYSDADWREIPGKRSELLTLCKEISARTDHDLALSIDLGGLMVFAGNAKGLDAFESIVPTVQNRFPMRLANHAAFHTALQKPVSKLGNKALSVDMFQQPNVPLIDGRGAIWHPHATDTSALWDYTVGHQVTKAYDFAEAIKVAAQELCPDVFIVLGPGNTLGGSVAQSLLRSGWRAIKSKAEFQESETEHKRLISMGTTPA